MLQFTKRILVAAVATLALIGGSAQASDPYCPPAYVIKKVTCYETVTCYATRCVTYKVCVTKYDHCGYPYHVYETRYREVEVPVQKQVAVTKYVKVPAY